MPGQGRVGDRALGIDKHRCNACPHVVSGPATQGSGNVIVNGKPAVRKGDKGKHAACCGSNTWNAQAGTPAVIINGMKAFRVGDMTDHCGGKGVQITASGNVISGNNLSGGSGGAASSCAPLVCDCDTGE